MLKIPESEFHPCVNIRKEFIFIKPLCDFFGINHQRQYVRIQNDVILARSCTKMCKMLANGHNYPRIWLDKRGFIRWIQIINPILLPKKNRNHSLIIKRWFLIISSSYRMKTLSLIWIVNRESNWRLCRTVVPLSSD